MFLIDFFKQVLILFSFVALQLKPLIILFFIVYIWAYAIFNAVNAKAEEPTITIPYTEEQMCKAFLRAEICDMTRVEQEQYFLERFYLFYLM